MFKKEIKLHHFAILFSIINLVFYHWPFFHFVTDNANTSSFSGVFLLGSLFILAIVLNAFVFYVGLFLLRKVGKVLLAIFFVINAISVYFINTYQVIIDRSMIGNVFNTNYEESSSFFSFTLVLYIVLLGILPAILVFRFKILYPKLKRFSISAGSVLLFILALAYANSTNWLWIDKNSKSLGALAMPWSYVVNTFRYFHKINQENKEQIALPNARIKNHQKSVFVLVIGESARSQNFSLYGYKRNTNPLLSKIENLKIYDAQSCATYTTEGVKCILEYKQTNDLYEILPNYLFRNGVEVIWRTTNWGEPTVRIDQFKNKDALRKDCKSGNCEYDEVLLDGLKEQILASKKDKILVVLHTSTSHGPSYFEKYPKKYEVFSPVCKNVELSQCTSQELINAYDNSILYTDYLLATLIYDLKSLKGYQSSMIFVSDHGESLGENNLYMHGLPVSLAPVEQFSIPFLVWASDLSRIPKNVKNAEQHNVFHSALDFLGIESPIYDPKMSIYQ